MAAVLHCEIIQAVEETWTANIFVICLDKPESDLNIIDVEFGNQLGRILYLAKEKADAGEIDLLVVCSGKDKSFVAGADILTQLKLTGVEGEYSVYTNVRKFQSIFCVLESLPVPTITILNGTTLGAGMELALSCDFRVADSAFCKQIGLPEVKIGVLPGGGGCVRLPRLIGFRKAVEMIVTGQAIDSKKAINLGLVDELFTNTQTVLKSGLRDDGNAFYEYQWLSGILMCIENRVIGKKPFTITQHKDTTAVGATVDVVQLSGRISEEVMMSAVSENWQECERKAELKYPRESGCCRVLWHFVCHVLVYTLTFLQLWRKVGFKMVAPYACLHTTLRCLYAGTWQQAMSANAHGMAALIASAESSALMNLFLVTRKLKKLAMNFGLQTPGDNTSFKQMDCSVVVYVSNDMLPLSMPFVQSLLFNKITVTVVADKTVRQVMVSATILEHFNYALKRKYISNAEVDGRMSLLSVCDESGMMKCVEESGCTSVLVVSASSQSFPVENILQHSSKCVASSALYPLLMNTGDPSRKNTLTVEITPLTNQVPPEHVRCLSSLVAATGKIPVVTPPTPLTACGLHILLSHWSLAVSLVSVYRGNMSQSIVDKTLLSAGYSMGPFQTMKKFGKYYLPSQKQHGNENVHLQRLRKFIETSKIPPSERKRNLSLMRAKVADLFTLNLILSALYTRQVTSSVSEAAIDTLCVAGLVQFPPTEAGPLNFAARFGKKSTTSMFDEATKAVPFLVDVGGTKSLRKLFADVVFQGLFDPELIHKEEQPEGGLVNVFEKQKSNLVLLSGKELRRVGCTHGLKNKEVFLLPLVTVSVLVCMLTIVLCCPGFWWLFVC